MTIADEGFFFFNHFIDHIINHFAQRTGHQWGAVFLALINGNTIVNALLILQNQANTANQSFTEKNRKFFCPSRSCQPVAGLLNRRYCRINCLRKRAGPSSEATFRTRYNINRINPHASHFIGHFYTSINLPLHPLSRIACFQILLRQFINHARRYCIINHTGNKLDFSNINRSPHQQFRISLHGGRTY